MTTSTEGLLASDIEIVHRVLAHIDARTTDEGDSWREPVANYLDPARFEQELHLLRSLPSVFVPSAAIPNEGDHVERSVFGVPLFAVRGHDGRARVFRNACRHRGVALVEGTGCPRALVCPYHGWTYRLDGSLAHVPHADGFPDLDVHTRGLVEVASEELDGLIIVDAVDAELVDVEHVGVDDAHTRLSQLTNGRPWSNVVSGSEQLIAMTSRTLELNWKVLVEQFLEGYHIRATHRETFFPLQYDNLNVVETFGRNSRVTYPFRSIERLRDRPEAAWNVKRKLTYVYQLFPNVMLATFPDRVMTIVVDPIDVDHSMLITYSAGDPPECETRRLADASSGSERDTNSERDTHPERDTNSERDAPERTLLERGAVEDNAMSEAVQRGLHAGANDYLEFGRHESAIGHFHRMLDEHLAASIRATPVVARRR